MIPRIAVYLSKPKGSVAKKHMVIVDGAEVKTLCTRMKLTRGTFLPPETVVNCEGCKNRSWMKTISKFGRPQMVDAHGKILDWEEVARLQAIG